MARLLKPAINAIDADDLKKEGDDYGGSLYCYRYDLFKKNEKGRILGTFLNCAYGISRFQNGQMMVYIQHQTNDIRRTNDCLYLVSPSGQVKEKYPVDECPLKVCDIFFFNARIWLYGSFKSREMHVMYFDFSTHNFKLHAQIHLPNGLDWHDRVYFVTNPLNELFYIQYSNRLHDTHYNIRIQNESYQFDPYPNHIILECSDQGILWCRSKVRKSKKLSLFDLRSDRTLEYSSNYFDDSKYRFGSKYHYEPKDSIMHLIKYAYINQEIEPETYSFECYAYDFYPGCKLPPKLDEMFRVILLCHSHCVSLSLLPMELLFLIFDSLYQDFEDWFAIDK